MFKKVTIFIVAMIFCANLFADSLSFQITYDSKNSDCPYTGQVAISENGDVKISSANFPDEVTKSIESSLQGVQIYKNSIAQAQSQIIDIINQSIGTVSVVRFDPAASSQNPFIREQIEENRQFEKELYADIYHPKFNSEFLKTSIEFDPKDTNERYALKTYRAAQEERYHQLSKNTKFHEAEYVKKLIEIRQLKREVLPVEDLNALTDLSGAMLADNHNRVITAMSWLFKSHEFQKGFASSIANNFNPASFLYPIEASCQSHWCDTGRLVGDATSLLMGAYEFMNGVMLTIGGSGMTLALASATGGLGTLALPATAATAIAGVSMAGHGLSVMNSAFTNLFREIETPKNIQAADKSKEVIDAASKFGIKSRQGIEVYSHIYEATKNLPNNLKIKQMREGTDVKKIAIVERKMNGVVNETALHLRKNKIEVETFSPSEKAFNEYLKFKEINNREPTFIEQKTMLTYKENLNWVNRLKEEGYTVLDMGNPTNVTELSPFYEMEIELLFNEVAL